MKKSWWLISLFASLGLLAVILVWSPWSARRGMVETALPAQPIAATAPVATPVAAPAPSPVPVRASAVTKFKDWSATYLAAPTVAAKSALVADGIALAQERRAEMETLIKTDPKSAIENAASYSLRKSLPPAIKDLLEQPVSGRGKVSSLAYTPLPGRESEVPPTEYHVEINQTRYDAYVYGSRVYSPERHGAAVYGVAIGKALALSEDAARVLEPEEAKDLTAAGKVPGDPICSVTGASSLVKNEETLVEYGSDVYRLCGPSHAFQLRGRLKGAENAVWAAAGASGGNPTNLPPPNPSTTQGPQELLIIPVRYADDPRASITPDQLQSLARNINQYYVDGSYGSEYMVPTITPVITLPFPRDYYDENFFTMDSDATTIAAAMGYPAARFNLVVAPQLPGAKFGGIASVGGSFAVVFGTGGASNHELGHNHGLLHANFFDTTKSFVNPTNVPATPNQPFDRDSVIGHDDINAPVRSGFTKRPQFGNILEYGHPFDVMGSGGGHFSALVKNTILGWLPPQHVRAITQSETNRLFAFDTSVIFPNRSYALRVHKNRSRGDYWLSYRQGIANNPWSQNGVEVEWNDGNGPLLLDTTPGTPAGRNDGMVVVGRTFTDPQADLHVTPVARGGAGTNAWLDVVVHLGPFPTNQAPTLSLTASGVTVSNGATVMFTANATDPDGDALAYYWEFGDGSFGPNAAVVSKTFTNDGQYVITCDASDMKGGVSSAHVWWWARRRRSR